MTNLSQWQCRFCGTMSAGDNITHNGSWCLGDSGAAAASHVWLPVANKHILISCYCTDCDLLTPDVPFASCMAAGHDINIAWLCQRCDRDYPYHERYASEIEMHCRYFCSECDEEYDSEDDADYCCTEQSWRESAGCEADHARRDDYR